MISYDEALNLIREQKLPSRTAQLPLESAFGLPLAAPVDSKVSSPVFNNSAMDGFAFKFSDIDSPLAIVGSIYAGKIDPDNIPAYKSRSCVRIMTGAFLPEWADTVVPVEQTSVENEHVHISERPKAGSNIRTKGEDIEQGVRALGEGMNLTPERAMVAAALGISEVSVKIPPKVFFLSTGDELKDPGQALAVGEIYNSSKIFLQAAAKAAGVDNPVSKTVSDQPGDAQRQLSEILALPGSKIIISTGAVSAGDADFIPSLARDLGFEQVFHKVAIRPGKPVFLGQKDDAIWLGLPGNPISTCVGWYFFALPLLQSLVGARAPKLYNFKLNNDVRKPEGLRCFFRAEIRDKRAWVPTNQGSGHFASSVNQDGFVILPEGSSIVKADTVVSGILIS